MLKFGTVTSDDNKSCIINTYTLWAPDWYQSLIFAIIPTSDTVIDAPLWLVNCLDTWNDVVLPDTVNTPDDGVDVWSFIEPVPAAGENECALYCNWPEPVPFCIWFPNW